MTAVNPVSRALLGRLSPGAAQAERAAFVARWDRVEALVVAVYRADEAAAEDEAVYVDLRGWFADAYPRCAPDLEAHWRAVRAGDGDGHPADDPFVALLARPSAASFAGDWDAMRLLPAAREAVNRWLLSEVGDGDGADPAPHAAP